MGNAQQSTRRTRHLDIKVFSLQDWISEDLLILHTVTSNLNIADVFTKQLGKVLFNKHYDMLMGYKYPL